MSLLGKVRAQCPNGCQPRDVEIWSYIDGGRDGVLRDSMLAGDLNLVSCEECGAMFYPEATVVYSDAEAELVAFVFPESYRNEEVRWRRKMEEDYAQMRKILAEKNSAVIEPTLYFGIDLLRQQLRSEEELADEAKIAELICQNLNLSLYSVARPFARAQNLPWLLPYRGSASFSSVLSGLKTLLNANDRLEGYRRWRKILEASHSLPPGTPRRLHS